MINQSNLKKLQNLLKEKNADIFIINRSDEYLNEYISPNAERLNFVTNFSGSAGKAIITPNEAFLYVDGRYTFQAKTQINAEKIKQKHLNTFWHELEKILLENEFKIAIDPKLHSIEEIEKIKKILKNSKSQLEFIPKNFVDLIWDNQPKIEYTDIFDHPIKFSGQSRDEKLNLLNNFLDQNKLNYYFITGLDNIAWLLNLRANDIKYTPLFYAYLLISKNNKHSLYLKESAMSELLRKEINQVVDIYSIENINVIFEKISPNDTIGLDYKSTTYFFLDLLVKQNSKYKNISNPCILLKAIKNEIELNGARKAHIRDGVSITKYIFWLKNKINIKKISEISSAKYLNDLRKKNELFHSLSFDTISAIGKNAALPHYRVSENSNSNFNLNKIYLVDSGAQYYDGTTDITRTIILGESSQEQKEMFTRVLKGHIALSTHIFKKGTKGNDIDYLARESLNEIGCDYDHGTGHGIGSFLSVHEGPQRISKKTMFDNIELMPGMIVSNEPGYYKINEYGIRIENLIIVQEDKNNLFFENLTWCPIDRDLMEKKLLTEKEINWINNYHEKVFQYINKYLNEEEKKWLRIVTKAI